MRKSLCLSLACILLAGALCNAAEQKTKVRSLAVFKNGLGFVTKTGSVTLSNGWTEIDEIPQAVLGTFWIGSLNPSQRVMEVVSTKVKITKDYQALDFSELLDSNIGKEVTITKSVGATDADKVLIGTVISVPSPPKEDDTLPVTPVNTRYTTDRSVGQMVIIKDLKGRIHAISKGLIQEVTLTDSSVLTKGVEREVHKAKVRVNGDSGKAELAISYLEKGITWAPGYLVDITDPKEALLTLEAVLSNDVEDMEDADVSFVVGYPNFAFSESVTPLSLQQSVANFIERLGRDQAASSAGAVMRQSMAYNNSYYAEAAPAPNYSAAVPMAGESNEDLYLYKQQKVTLKKGDRARYLIFSEKVPYEHIYEWSLSDSMNIDTFGNRSGNRDTQDQSQVWHSLRLVNSSKNPWTTAPAFTIKKDLPVAQDTLKYTPQGGKSTLKLTVATDVRGEQEQIELSRTPTKLYNRDYDEVTVHGKLTVKNWKPDAIKLIVKKSLIGEALKIGQGGKAAKVVKQLNATNPTTEVEWEFTLDPKAEKTLEYQYKVLIYR